MGATLEPQLMPRYILNHPELGVFVGECLGLVFWSQLDAVGQSEVVTFPDESSARYELKMMYPTDSSAAEVIKVETDTPYATEAQCVAAGAKPWTKQ